MKDSIRICSTVEYQHEPVLRQWESFAFTWYQDRVDMKWVVICPLHVPLAVICPLHVPLAVICPLHVQAKLRMHTVGIPVRLQPSGLGWCIVGSPVAFVPVTRQRPVHTAKLVLAVFYLMLALVMAHTAPALETNAVVALWSSLHSIYDQPVHCKSDLDCGYKATIALILRTEVAQTIVRHQPGVKCHLSVYLSDNH